MGNLKNCDKLIDKIDEELSWRKKELTQMRFIVSTATTENELTILRSSIVLLYAHWEGLVKKLLTLYLEHIVAQSLHNYELKPNFYAMSLSSEFEQFKNTKKIHHYIDLTNAILNSTNNIPNIPCEKIIDTKSNLNSALFKELMMLLDLDTSIHDTSFNLIDERLLARRNGIAHGENRKRFPLDKEEYDDIHTRILQIMDDLATQIKDAAENKSYKNTSIIQNQAIEEPLPIG